MACYELAQYLTPSIVNIITAYADMTTMIDIQTVTHRLHLNRQLLHPNESKQRRLRSIHIEGVYPQLLPMKNWILPLYIYNACMTGLLQEKDFVSKSLSARAKVRVHIELIILYPVIIKILFVFITWSFSFGTDDLCVS